MSGVLWGLAVLLAGGREETDKEFIAAGFHAGFSSLFSAGSVSSPAGFRLTFPVGEPSAQSKLGKFEKPFRKKDGSSGRRRSSSSSKVDGHEDRHPTHFHGHARSGYGSGPSPGRFRSRGGGISWIGANLRFATFPYEESHDDELPPRRNYFLGSVESDRRVAGDLRSSYMRVDDDLSSWGLAGQVRFSQGLDLDFDIAYFVEQLEGRRDRLTLQDYCLNWGPAFPLDDFHVSVGAGLAVLRGEESHAGISFQAAAEWYPVEPVSLRALVGWMGFEEASLTDLQFEARIHIGRFALTAGVRSLINSEGDDLTGPMVGLGIWF